MKLSVIIATMNRPDDLKAALGSLLKQTRFPDQVLIIDQSEDERSRNVIEDARALSGQRAGCFQYVKQEEKSLVKARNRGLALADGDILSFLDDDVVLYDDYFERILNVWQEHPEAVAISGNTIIREPIQGWKWAMRKALSHFFLLSHFDGRMTASGFGYPIYEREIDRLLTVEMLPGCNMNFKRSAIGDERFDEWFKGYSYREDAEFSYRMSKRGPVLMVPDAKLWHNYSTVSRLTEEQLQPMKIKNYHYMFRKFKGDGVWPSMLFGYSLLGLILIDLVEYLSRRTPGKWGKLRAGVSASFSVLRRP